MFIHMYTYYPHNWVLDVKITPIGLGFGHIHTYIYAYIYICIYV